MTIDLSTVHAPDEPEPYNPDAPDDVDEPVQCPACHCIRAKLAAGEECPGCVDQFGGGM